MGANGVLADPAVGIDSALLGRLADELAARLRAGEAVDFEALAAEHPEHAEALRRLLPALALLAEVSHTTSQSVEGIGVPLAVDEKSLNGTLGDFRLLREVGRGGMGVVYEAEQISLNRRVALKVLPFASTMDPKQLQRFKNEAKAAASLRHEHIVHVYGVGCERSVHFYAMEFIDGRTLAQVIHDLHTTPSSLHQGHGKAEAPTADATSPYVPIADAPTPPVAALSTERSGPKNREYYRTAARQIAQAADALEHAHGLGIVHRDVKPGNLLVDAAGKIYVSDFGLARVGADAGLTVSGDLLGTLRYMAPEQAMSRHGLVDHRADVYGLGCTLYELLTGSPAVDATERAEMLRQIAFEEPKPPRKLEKSIPAELETITLKALAKNPNERYATAAALADDLRRWLDHQTIKARRPSLRQRLDKWTRRHSGAVVAAAAALLIGTAVSAWQAVRATAAQQAEAQRADAEMQAKELAQKRLAQIEKGNDILGSIFKDLDPKAEEKEGKPLRALLGAQLDRATAELDGEALGGPLAMAKLQMTLANAQIGLGYAEKAIALYSRARATFTATLGSDHPDTLTSMRKLAGAYHAAGRSDQALPLAEEALKSHRAKLGTENPDTLASMSTLAVVYMEGTGNINQARALMEELVKLREAALGPDHAATLASMHNLSAAYGKGGMWDQSLSLLDEVYKRRKAKLGPDHPDTINSMHNLGAAYYASWKLDSALPLLEESYRLQKAKLGPDHPETVHSMSNLAMAYSVAGKSDQALSLAEESFNLLKAKLGRGHRKTLWSMFTLAWVQSGAGKAELALPLLEEVLTLQKAGLGSDHPDTLHTMTTLVEVYADVRKFDQARALAEEALQLNRAKSGPENVLTINSMSCLAGVHTAAGQPDRAVPLLEESVRRGKANQGPEHPNTLMNMVELADAYQAAGKLDRAIPLLQDVTHIQKTTLGPDQPATLLSMTRLAAAYLDAEKLSQALPLAKEAVELRKARLGPEHPETLKSMAVLARAHGEAQKYDDAIRLAREVLAVQRRKLSGDDPKLADTLDLLGRILLDARQPAEADSMLRECLAIRVKKTSDAWMTFEAKSLLGGALLQQQKYAEAKPLLLQGYEGMKQREATIVPREKRQLIEAGERVARLYEATNQPEKAKEWREKLAAEKRPGG